MINIIVARDRNNGIGKDGDLLCRITADLKRFKALTTGHDIIMGRRTFESGTAAIGTIRHTAGTAAGEMECLSAIPKPVCTYQAA